MSWLTLVVAATVVAVILGLVFPSLTRWVLTWVQRLKFTILAIIAIPVALYFLTSGNLLLMAIGFVAVMLTVWNVMFNNPFGWLRPFLPG